MEQRRQPESGIINIGKLKKIPSQSLMLSHSNRCALARNKWRTFILARQIICLLGNGGKQGGKLRSCTFVLLALYSKSKNTCLISSDLESQKTITYIGVIQFKGPNSTGKKFVMFIFAFLQFPIHLCKELWRSRIWQILLKFTRAFL